MKIRKNKVDSIPENIFNLRKKKEKNKYIFDQIELKFFQELKIKIVSHKYTSAFKWLPIMQTG